MQQKKNLITYEWQKRLYRNRHELFFRLVFDMKLSYKKNEEMKFLKKPKNDNTAN